MAYIVDLTNVMRSVFWLTQDAELDQPLTPELCEIAVKAYEHSQVKHDIHRDIRVFIKEVNIFQFAKRDKIFDKVVDLIKKHQFRPEERFMKEARQVLQASN